MRASLGGSGTYLALCLIAAAPLAFVHHLPSGDGPEHLLQAVFAARLEAGDPMLAAFELYPRPATSALAASLIRPLLVAFEPAPALRVYAALALLALGLAILFAAPRGGVLALLPLPAVLMDVSFTKGFFSFYGSLALACLALGASRRSWPLYAILAAFTVFGHPLAYVLLGLAMLAEAGAGRARLRPLALASIPSILAGLWIFSGLLAGQGATPNRARYLFPIGEKLLRFFEEGWHTLAPAQLYPVYAAFALWLAALARARRMPWRALAAFALFLTLPEEFGGWSWISIRVPLVVAVALAFDLAESPPRARAFAPTAAAIVVAAAAITLAAMRPLDARITEYVEAGRAVPEGVPLLPITPAVPPDTRVDVMLHAAAYIAMERGTPYPEIFARDPRYHWISVRPEVRPLVYDLGAPLPWRERVSFANRAAWFAAHGGTALAFDADAETMAALARAATSTVVGPRHRIYTAPLR